MHYIGSIVRLRMDYANLLRHAITHVLDMRPGPWLVSTTGALPAVQADRAWGHTTCCKSMHALQSVVVAEVILVPSPDRPELLPRAGHPRFEIWRPEHRVRRDKPSPCSQRSGHS